MKKIILIICALALLVSAAFAGGVSVWTETKQLYSAATGTTVAVTSTRANFDNPVRDLGCDIATSPTGTAVVRIEGTSAYGGFDTTGLATATTCSTANCFFAITGKPVTSIRAVITTTTSTTSTVKVNCTGMQ